MNSGWNGKRRRTEGGEGKGPYVAVAPLIALLLLLLMLLVDVGQEARFIPAAGDHLQRH